MSCSPAVPIRALGDPLHHLQKESPQIFNCPLGSGWDLLSYKKGKREEKRGAGFLTSQNDSDPSSKDVLFFQQGRIKNVGVKLLAAAKKKIIWMRIFLDCFERRVSWLYCVYGLGQLSGLHALSWSWQGWEPRGHLPHSQQGLPVGEHLSRNSPRSPKGPHLVFPFFFDECTACGIIVLWLGIEPSN